MTCIADRSAYSILVPVAGSMAGIGVIRSLGKAGYRVHAAAAEAGALGLRSRFATETVVHPPTSSPEFVGWLRQYLGTWNINMVMPGWRSDLHLDPVLCEFSKLFPYSDSADILRIARSKSLLFNRLAEGGKGHRANLPPYIVLDFDSQEPSEKELSTFPLPLFIKVDSALARESAGDAVIRVTSTSEALRQLRGLAGRYRMALIQGYVPGQGVGAFILRWEGRTIARMMHLRLHEMPHTGGASSLRRTWWNETIMRDAELKLSHLGWEGVAMVEYRWDPVTTKFYLMEMNLRFWGSLHLALYAGVDFPRLLADAFLMRFIPHFPIGIERDMICRNTLPFELGYLVSLWRDSEVPLGHKIYAGLEAVKLCLDLRVRNDLLYPGDRRLYFERIKDMILGVRDRE